MIDRALPRRVLLVEDDEPMRTIIVRALRRGGFDVVEAASGHDALEILAASFGGPIRFDAVVSDVRMPGYDGLNLVVLVSRLPRPLPAIVITAFGTKELHDAARRAGAVATLDKPFALASLVELVRAVTGIAP